MTEKNVQRIRVRDLPTVRRMVYANMVGHDAQFTALIENPLQKFFLDASMYPYLLTNGTGFKYVVQNEILGCAYVHVEQRRSSGFVFNVNVNEEARRQGVGLALMEQIERFGRKKNLDWLLLWVDGPNEGARKFYGRLDYRPFRPTHFHSQNLAPIFNTPYDPHIRLETLPTTEGQRIFAASDARAQKEGDAWASQIYKNEYAHRAHKTAGRTVRILHNHINVGTAKLAGSTQHPVIALRLYQIAWAQAWLPALLRQLLDDYLVADEFTLHLGSSGHSQTVFPMLSELGFVNRPNPKILMVKALT